MNDAIAIYLAAALLLAVAGGAFALMVRFAPALVADRPDRWHRWGWLLIALALALPAAWHLGGQARRGPAPIELWTGAAGWAGGPALPRVTIRSAATAASAPVVHIERWAMGAALVFGLGGVLLSTLALLRERRRLQALCASLPVVKRVGRVHLCASDLCPVPFAARVRGRAYIVVPTSLLADVARLRLVISHEAQHHRRGDLLSALGLEVLRVFFFWNPAVASWKRLMAELQDLACDGQVLRRRAVSAVEYGHCLLWAAEAAHERRFRLAGARAMAAASNASLHRRMVAILREQGGRPRRWLS